MKQMRLFSKKSHIGVWFGFSDLSSVVGAACIFYLGIQSLNRSVTYNEELTVIGTDTAYDINLGMTKKCRHL